MSVDAARSLVQRVTTDSDFRARLEAADVADRRTIIEEAGYGEVRLAHVAQALPQSAGGELSDDEFAAVAGGEITNTKPSDTAITIMSGSTSVAAAVIAGALVGGVA
ncbi:MAG: Nif11-like leader peptide family RiPP precursor [Actinomycetota bacterium]